MPRLSRRAEHLFRARAAKLVKSDPDQTLADVLADLTLSYGDHTDSDEDSVEIDVSHSLVQERVYKLKYDAAAWTSFSQDHLDFHKDLNEYFHAKTLLIEKHLKIGSPCFIPAYEEELYAKLKNYSATHKTKTLIERKVEKLPLFFMSHFNKSNLEVAWDICEYLWKRKVSPDLFKFKMTEGRFSIFAFQDKKI